MQHAKKMVLTPQDAVIPGHTQLEQARTVQTPGTMLSRLDAEMADILGSVTSSNQREKWKLYQQVLQRYQFFTDEERRPPLTNDKPVKETERTTDEAIVASVPGKYKKQAQQLLNYLHDSANTKLTWDKSGVVLIDGEPIKDSNIIDLVNDAMRHRKTVRAIGRQQFGAELRLMGVPREFIGNSSMLYENLTLSPPPINSSVASQSNDYTPNTSRSNLNSSDITEPRRRTPTSDNIRGWKRFNID